jgi:hypothetical protein
LRFFWFDDFNLAKQRYDLLRAKPLLRHDPSSFPSSFSHNAWFKKARAGQSARPFLVGL